MRIALLGALVGLSVACGSNGGDGPAPGPIDGPRGEQLAGTGTDDVTVLDAKSDFARNAGIAWWEVELHLVDDDADVTTGVISTADSMRIAVDFWAHDEGGAAIASGRFAVDATRWLSLTEERDPSDIAAIFDGSRVEVPGRSLTSDERAAYLADVLATVLTSGDPVSAKLLHVRSLDDLKTCGKPALDAALSSISKSFGTCTKCASDAIDSTDSAWESCGKCETAIKSTKDAGGLFDLLACKKALVWPGSGGDPDDAAGPLVTPPDGAADATCYASSSDKVHGTFRVTDGKGAVTCADCPSGMTPVDTKLGCAPASDDTYSPVDESKSVVLVPEGKGKPASPRVLSSDVCVVVDVTATGTVNGMPVEPGPRRAIYKLGDRGWAALPKSAATSKDTWDLTADSHASSSKGRYAIASSKPATKTPKAAGSVSDAIARGGCSSHPVMGLSDQIREELARCVRPGFLVKVPSGGMLSNSADHPWLEKPAADALQAALRKRPGHTLGINSMYRTIAQQYFLYQRSSCFSAVAKPGRSNHETGIAIDVRDPDNAVWRSTLESVGFKWLGSFDRYHFDFKGAGSQDLRGDDIKAFQRLWNRNHPDDKIGEDGVWGPDTEKRLAASPAAGFPIGVPDSCEAAPEIGTSKGSKEPYSYVTNVTTAELLPGEGCEKGSDASHTSVDACVTVKQVCEPYWCDLADRRSDACR